MLGISIYIVIQAALLAFAIYIAFNWKEIRLRHAHRKDKAWGKIAGSSINQPEVRLYFYRSHDGASICGPISGAKLASLFRMGQVTPDTPVADENTPEVWKPLRDRSDLDLS